MAAEGTMAGAVAAATAAMDTTLAAAAAVKHCGMGRPGAREAAGLLHAAARSAKAALCLLGSQAGGDADASRRRRRRGKKLKDVKNGDDEGTTTSGAGSDVESAGSSGQWSVNGPTAAAGTTVAAKCDQLASTSSEAESDHKEAETNKAIGLVHKQLAAHCAPVETASVKLSFGIHSLQRATATKSAKSESAESVAVPVPCNVGLEPEVHGDPEVREDGKEVESTLEQEGHRLIQLCATYGSDSLPKHVKNELLTWVFKKLDEDSPVGDSL